MSAARVSDRYLGYVHEEKSVVELSSSVTLSRLFVIVTHLQWPKSAPTLLKNVPNECTLPKP